MGDPALFASHAQQAFEKPFKAWLAFSSGTGPLTRDLAELLGLVKAREPAADRFDMLVDYSRIAL